MILLNLTMDVRVSSDPDTPRGPLLEIRPQPQAIRAWDEAARFIVGEIIDLPPYHYGTVTQCLD